MGAGPPKVLVVEDDEGTRVFVEALLKVEGYLVQGAPDGAAGLEKARVFAPQVLISEIEMPGLSGPDLVRGLRAEERLRGCYVVVLTAKGDKDSKLEALRAGADDFIVKPVRPGEVLGRVEIGLRVLAAEAKAAASQAEIARVRSVHDALRGDLALLRKRLGDAEAVLRGSREPRSLEAVRDALAVADRAAIAAGGPKALPGA
jgi:DNA-binding response OmpR family regulator